MTDLRMLPWDVAARQLPCSLCPRPARWLLWSDDPALVCAECGKNATAIDVDVREVEGK